MPQDSCKRKKRIQLPWPGVHRGTSSGCAAICILYALPHSIVGMHVSTQQQQGVRSLLTEALLPYRKTLLEAAGFKFSRLGETRGVFSLVEAIPAPIPKQVEGSEGSGSQDIHINLKTKYLKEYGVISVNLDLEPEP